MLYPVFATATVKVPPAVKPLMGRVYIDPFAVREPLVTPATPLNVMSLESRPAMLALKVRVKAVVVWVELPFAVTSMKVTGVSVGDV